MKTMKKATNNQSKNTTQYFDIWVRRNVDTGEIVYISKTYDEAKERGPLVCGFGASSKPQRMRVKMA